MRQVDDSAHGKCPSKKAVESVQVDFREKVQLAVDTPLEVFGEQFQCTVFVDSSRYRFIDFQTKSFLLFERLGFYNFGNQSTAVQINTGFDIAIYGFVASFHGIAPFHHFIVVTHL